MDNYLIDTSSLISLVRYYNPFDRDKKLRRKIQKMFITEQCFLLESVLNEAKRVSQGIVLQTYDFLSKEEKGEKKINLIKNVSPIPDECHERIDATWAIQDRKDKIKSQEYSERKEKEIQQADFQLIFTVKYNNKCKEAIIVTEESKSINDSKDFKKIPAICEIENIPCITLPEMLKKAGIQLEYKINN